MSPDLSSARKAPEVGKIATLAGDSPILRGVYVHRMGENAEDERRVAEFWRASGLEVEALEDPSERFSPRPDLRLSHDGKPWALCEVKTIWRHSWTVRVTHEDRPPEEHREISNLPVDERISGDLVTAARQLRAGNPDHVLLNFVVLVNRDPEVSISGLAGVFSMQPASGLRGLAARRAARLAKDVRDFRSDIDLCIWATEQMDGKLALDGCFLFNPDLREQAKQIAGLGSAKLFTLEPAA